MQEKRIQKYIITLCLFIFQILYSITIPPSSSLNVIYIHILSPPARTTYHMIFEQFVCNILLSISIFFAEHFLLLSAGYRGDLSCAHWPVAGAAILRWLPLCCLQVQSD